MSTTVRQIMANLHFAYDCTTYMVTIQFILPSTGCVQVDIDMIFCVFNLVPPRQNVIRLGGLRSKKYMIGIWWDIKNLQDPHVTLLITQHSSSTHIHWTCLPTQCSRTKVVTGLLLLLQWDQSEIVTVMAKMVIVPELFATMYGLSCSFDYCYA